MENKMHNNIDMILDTYELAIKEQDKEVQQRMIEATKQYLEWFNEKIRRLLHETGENYTGETVNFILWQQH